MSVVAKPAPATLGKADRRVLELLAEHGDHSSAFLTFNDGTEHYLDPAIDGFVAYRPAGGRHVVQLCGPVAAADDRPRLLESFKRWAKSEGRRITAVQLLREDGELYARSGFTVNQFGTSYGIELERFTLRGTRFMKLRNKLKRSKRLGVTVEELAPGERPEAPLAEVDRTWLKAKGRLAKELRFMVGERAGRGAAERRVFVARREGETIAYVTYSPVWGSRPGWLYDLTRRRPDSPPGTVELIFHTALERLQEEGVRWLHLGLTPYVGFSHDHEIPGYNRVAHTIMEQMGRRAGFLYPALTQLDFKLKWAPHVVEPEYIAWEGGVNPGALFQLMRVTGSI
ncbi:MAG TPA: DUF2156 domain-containing protein [Thermoleophilaceae bacterium]|nr:DUF2156 domain-containing protein [Thermoleophilaceae bacterium]